MCTGSKFELEQSDSRREREKFLETKIFVFNFLFHVQLCTNPFRGFDIWRTDCLHSYTLDLQIDSTWQQVVLSPNEWSVIGPNKSRKRFTMYMYIVWVSFMLIFFYLVALITFPWYQERTVRTQDVAVVVSLSFSRSILTSYCCPKVWIKELIEGIWILPRNNSNVKW